MNAVSLFAGVGGFDLALERAGVPVVAAVEIDKQARGVLAHRFPNTKLFGDIQEVTGNDLLGAGFIAKSGIITGGFPCQDLSVAGRRAGLAGERSGLFWEIARLLDDLQPRWFVLENVPGLLSSNGGRDMGIVLGTLAELGYGVAYRVLDAQNFGVPQRRRRVFIVGRLGSNGQAPSEILAIRQGLFGDSSQSDTAREETTGSASQSVASPLQARGYKGIIAFSHTQGLDAQPSEKHTPTLRKNGGGQAMTDGELVRRLTPVECERLQGFPDDWTKYRVDEKKGLIEQADSPRYKQMGNAVAVPCVEWIINRLVEG